MMRKERKKEKEQNRSKSILKRFNFQTLPKVIGTLQVVLHLDSDVLLVYGLFALLLARLGVHTPMPYVQDAMCHPYIVVATATTDEQGPNIG